MKEQLYYVKTSFKYGFYGFSFQSLLKSAILDMHTVFSLLGPPGGLFFSGPFKGGGGGLLERGGLIWEGGLFISWQNYMIIFLQHKEMCVKQLCILTILTQL